MALVKGEIRVSEVEINKYEAFNALVEELGLENLFDLRDLDCYWKLEETNGKKYLVQFEDGRRSYTNVISDPKKIRLYELLKEVKTIMRRVK